MSRVKYDANKLAYKAQHEEHRKGPITNEENIKRHEARKMNRAQARAKKTK